MIMKSNEQKNLDFKEQINSENDKKLVESNLTIQNL